MDADEVHRQSHMVRASSFRMAPMDSRELLVRRSASQLLARRIDRAPEAIVHALLAVQAQDRGAWRLALRARGSGFSAADVDKALTERRSLVVAWLNRGTLHLVAAEDYPWLIALTAPTKVASNRRRLAQEGLTPNEVDRAMGVIERALTDDGPLPRSELRRRLAAQGIRTAGQATVHLLFAAVIRGVALQGPMIGKEHAFALVRDWLGVDQDPLAPLPAERRETALAELARGYLRGHGPATEADLAKWAGLPLRDARAGLRSIASEIGELAGPAGPLLDLVGRSSTPDLLTPLPARLLPGFDPCLLGWREREPFVAARDDARVVPSGGGFFLPTAIVDGTAAATWSTRRQGDRIAVRMDPFRPLGPEDAAALATDAKDVARFEGRTLD
jgi:hypothetical protein